MLERPTKELPDAPGLWHREGKSYRVWKRDDGSFGAEHIDANGMIGAYYGNDLPTGNWQPLAPPVTLSEARYSFLKWLTPNGCNVRAGLTCGMIADKAAEECGRVEQEPGQIACLKGIIARQDAEITDLKATIARLEGEVAKLTKDLVREQRDHLGTIDHRDQHEERINRIVGCLGLGEYESSWTSLNDPSERAIEAIEELQRRVEASQPEVITGKGQAVEAEVANYMDEWPDGCIQMVRFGPDSIFKVGHRYMRCPTFPPRQTFTPPKPELVLVRWRNAVGNTRDFYAVKRPNGCWHDPIENVDYLRVELLDETTGEVRNG